MVLQQQTATVAQNKVTEGVLMDMLMATSEKWVDI